MKSLLQVKGLSFTLPTGHVVQGRKTILDNISFDIPKGSATAYLGPNGAGKTSTFRILCGLAKSDSGQIYFDGKRILGGLPPKQFGFMPEQPYFYKNLTPNELLTGLGRLSGLNGSSLTKSILEWSEKLHFTKILNQRLATCSKGQVQRVGLAQALIHQPDFILLDEPLSGLDPLGRECVSEVIQSEIKRGATMLFSSHILADAENMCENVIVLKEGTILFSGNMKTLIAAENNWSIRTVWQDESLPVFETTETSRNVDGTIRIKGSSEKVRDDVITHILASSGATLVSVEPERRTLEQAFVNLLKGENQ